MGTCHFQAPTQQKPLDRSFSNFAQLITSARPLNVPKMVTIGWVGAAPHIGETQAYIPYLTLPYLFFVSLPSLQTRPLNRFARTISQTTRIAPRKCLLGVSSMKKIFSRGNIPSPKFSKGIFTCKSKMSNNFGQVKDNRKIPKPTYTKSGSSNRTVTSLPV
jgi:hypothetical protein